MLAEGAAALRPGQPFAARLCRVDGNDLVVEGAAAAYIEDASGHAAAGVGERVALAETAHAGLLDDGLTRSWDDLHDNPSENGYGDLGRLGARALIATPIRVGPTQYTISFASAQPMERPFDANDRAYVEIFAGYVERALQQRWQAERLRFQIQHDALTGLINRSQFRARVHDVLADTGSCGLAIVDVADLRDVNGRLGYQTGDALLVEVGAALTGFNRDGEFTGRLYGGSFGICFPRIGSRGMLERRITEYARRFGAPFSTGDRARAEWVPLAASFGTALAPQDARTADDLIARAEAALPPQRSHPF